MFQRQLKAVEVTSSRSCFFIIFIFFFFFYFFFFFFLCVCMCFFVSVWCCKWWARKCQMRALVENFLNASRNKCEGIKVRGEWFDCEFAAPADSLGCLHVLPLFKVADYYCWNDHFVRLLLMSLRTRNWNWKRETWRREMLRRGRRRRKCELLKWWTASAVTT